MISLDDMKKSLRISHDALDDEINDTMQAAVLDIQREGISADVDNELTDMLIKLYVKWQLNYMDKAEQYQKNYIALMQSMALSEGYINGTN